MKHLKSLNYCKRMIKSTSAFGNASKGFASNEVAQTDKSLKDQAVKLSLMLVSGALLWSGGGVQEVKAQVCGDGGQLVTRYERFLRIAGQVICKHTIPRDSLRSWRVTNSNP